MDGRELSIFETDPTRKDTDEDGLTDGAEVNKHETNPTNPDTDGDGLRDGPEIHKYGTDPNSPDTDGDGSSDAVELRQGTDPAGGASGVLALLRQHLLLIAGIGVSLTLLIGILYQSYMRPSDTGGAGSSENVSGKAASETTTPSGVSSDPLTDADRVQQLLLDNGGRIRQAEIVKQTEWSKSKVSRLLSKMEAENQVTKITIGRENLITRPEDEPQNADTTIDD